MSHYNVFSDIRFKDVDLLLKGLQSLGYEVEQGDNLTLKGYYGNHPEKAQLAIRKKGPYNTDIGFVKRDDAYVPVLDNMGGNSLATQFKTAYSKQVVEEVNRRLRGSIQQQQEGRLTKLKVRY